MSVVDMFSAPEVKPAGRETEAGLYTSLPETAPRALMLAVAPVRPAPTPTVRMCVPGAVVLMELASLMAGVSTVLLPSCES